MSIIYIKYFTYCSYGHMILRQSGRESLILLLFSLAKERIKMGQPFCIHSAIVTSILHTGTVNKICCTHCDISSSCGIFSIIPLHLYSRVPLPYFHTFSHLYLMICVITGGDKCFTTRIFHTDNRSSKYFSLCIFYIIDPLSIKSRFSINCKMIFLWSFSKRSFKY